MALEQPKPTYTVLIDLHFLVMLMYVRSIGVLCVLFCTGWSSECEYKLVQSSGEVFKVQIERSHCSSLHQSKGQLITGHLRGDNMKIDIWHSAWDATPPV